MKINNIELNIIKGDIIEAEVDAIVNSANNKLTMGGGLALAIKKKGGDEIGRQAFKKGPLGMGQAIETQAGKLFAKYVIHAVTMGLDFKTDEVKIRGACRNSLELAGRLGLKSIALPALGCGIGGFAPTAAAKIMAQEILRHAKYASSALEKIILVLFNDEVFKIFQEQVVGYLDHMQNKLCTGPFITVDIIIEVDGRIVLIERFNPPFGWAIPGGFVEYGETLEDCARREAKEETDLDIYDLEQLHTYSDPERDPRFHTISTVFVSRAKGKPKSGDDAKNVKVITLDEISNLKLAFDHSGVLQDYKKFKQRKEAS